MIIITNRLKEWYQPNNIVSEEQSEFQPRSSFLAVSPLFLGLAGRPLLFCFATASLPREVRSTTPDARKRNSCHLVCYGSALHFKKVASLPEEHHLHDISTTRSFRPRLKSRGESSLRYCWSPISEATSSFQKHQQALRFEQLKRTVDARQEELYLKKVEQSGFLGKVH